MSKILVVGDVCQDIYLIGEATRLSPEAPVPIITNIREETRGGMAYNVAANIRALGGETSFYTIDNEIKKIRIIANNQQIARLDYEPPNDSLFKISIEGQYDVAVISDYGKGVCTPAVIATVMKAAKRVLVDPHPSKDPSVYDGAYLIKTNSHNSREYWAPIVITTAGPEGMYVDEAGWPREHVPATAQEVVDVTGAGDTVIAALAVALNQGKSVREAVEFANRAAAVVVRKFGTSTCSLAEILPG